MAYTVRNFLKDLKHPYAWPGGYPRYFITDDGGSLSYEAAKENKRIIFEAIRDKDKRSGWCVIGCDINWEDAELICDHTNKRIESAYGEDDSNEMGEESDGRTSEDETEGERASLS